MDAPARGPTPQLPHLDIRRTALTKNICHFTTLSAANAAAEAIAAVRDGALDVAPLQSYFKSET